MIDALKLASVDCAIEELAGMQVVIVGSPQGRRYDMCMLQQVM